MSDADGAASSQPSSRGRSPSSEVRVSWVYELNKQELIEKLKTYNVTVSETDSVDNLRKTLVKKLRGKNETFTKKELYRYDMFDFNKISFTLNKDNWEVFVERLELIFECQCISPERQSAELLTRVCQETFMLFRNLTSPKKAKDLSYSDLVNIMNSHLHPKPSEISERNKFYATKQLPSESIHAFLTKLKERSFYCNFKDLDIALRDQFVFGLINHETKVELFRQENLTFQSAVKIAEDREAAIKNSLSMKPAYAVSEDTIFYMNKAGSKYSNHQQYRGRGSGNAEGKFKSSHPNNAAAASTSKDQSQKLISDNRQRQHDNRSSYRREDRNGSRRSNVSNNSQVHITSKTRNNNKCYCCGGFNHFARDCKLRWKTCNYCNVKGHIDRACLKKQNGINLVNDNLLENEDLDSSDLDFYYMQQNNFTEFQVNNIVVEPHSMKLIIDNNQVELEVDTGSHVTVFSEKTVANYFAAKKIHKADISLSSYDRTKLNVMGMLTDLKVHFEGVEANLKAYVLAGNGKNLIGRQWLQALGMWPITFKPQFALNCLNDHNSIISHFKSKYPQLFDNSPGKYKGKSIKLTFKKDYQPIQCKPYHVPFALKDKVDAEIDRLVRIGNLEQVEVSEWATPVVPVVKGEGVRLCGNFKLTVNPQIIVKRYPLPLKEKVFQTLQVGTKWSQIDLKHAFMQFEVAEDCRDPLTIITQKGLFRYKKLPEGVASSPAECQDIVTDILKGIPNIEIYIDNIYCTGKNDSEHLDNLEKIFYRLNEAGLKVNESKCEFFRSEIEILGFKLDKTGLSPSPSRIHSIVNMPSPKTKKELQAFLGLVNFYESFLYKRADQLKVLYDVLKESKFYWNSNCDQAVNWVKKELASDKVLVPYQQDITLVLATDASYSGLSAILSHRFSDGTERPIAFASKLIPHNELHRSILDKEAAAIIFGFRKFYHYIVGNEIILKTDNQPLKYIFGNSKKLNVTIQNRLLRWIYFLSGFKYKIELISSSKNSNCDALSRLAVRDKMAVFDSELDVINFIENESNLIDLNLIKQETKKDKVLCDVKRKLMFGWVENSNDISLEEKMYFDKKTELSIENECLVRGSRLIIPKALRKTLLKSLHQSHFGIVRMKQVARSFFWWPGLDDDIEKLANSCELCVKNRKQNNKISTFQWPFPSNPWSRLHTDFLGPIQGNMFLVIVDAHSKWPEAINMKNNTSASKLIEVFDSIFSRFGLCDHLVSDNGPQFASEEFNEFLKSLGIRHTYSPPYHPATNGAAENFVGTFKNKVLKITGEGKSLNFAVNSFLFDYRTMKHSTTGKSPSDIIFKREIKTRFHLLRENLVSETSFKQFNMSDKNKISKIDFKLGDVVLVDVYNNNKRHRVQAKIVEKLSPVTFNLLCDGGRIIKRHVNQMLKFLSNDNDINKDLKDDISIRRSERLKNLNK